VRQWVLSLPWELRGLSAMKPGVVGAMDRIFAEEIARLTRRLAGIEGTQTGSVGCPQMFGSSLNLHVHFHTIAADGVFEKTDAGGVRFHEAPPSSKDHIAEVAQRVRDRAVRWLRRRGYLDERAAEDRSNETAEPSAIDGCTQLALAGGAFLARPSSTPNDTKDADLERRERRFSATCDGFDVHCAVRLAADDDLGRERLVRYCTRPPFALERIEVLRDGRIAYLLKVPRKGRTHRIMTPMEFMARLAALVPRPRIPLVRYHGVFASRSSWRKRVTPKPPTSVCKPKACAAPTSSASPSAASASAASPSAASPSAASPSAALPSAFASASSASAPSALEPPKGAGHATLDEVSVEPVVHVDPTMISVAHWGRLENGELFARTRYIAWAVMMKRTWGFDVLRCPTCARKMRVVATLTQPDVVRKILAHLGVRSTPLPRAPARDPPLEQTPLDFDAA
jgi:Putative transposase